MVRHTAGSLHPLTRRALLQALLLSPLMVASSSAWARNAAGGTIAATFGKLPAPAQVRSVFAAGSPAGVLVAVLAPDKLLGWPMPLDSEARSLLAPGLGALPTLGRLSGRASTVPLERLLALQPSLILDAGTVDATFRSAAARVTAQTGLPVVLVDGRLADIPAQLSDVGRLLGVPARGARLATDAQQTLDLVQRVLARVPPSQRPRVYYARGVDGLETGLQGSLNMEAIELVGGRNVATATGGVGRVSMEQVLAWNPDVILTQDAAFARRARTDPLWRSLRAVRAGRVHVAPSLPFGWIDGPPGVNRLIGLHWLLAKLYPGKHPALTAQALRAETLRFHQLYYGSTLSETTLDRLLGEGA